MLLEDAHWPALRPPGSGTHHLHRAFLSQEGKAERHPGSHGQQLYCKPLAMPWLDTLAGQSKCLCLPVRWPEWIYLALECRAFLIINCLARSPKRLESEGFPLCPKAHRAEGPAGFWETSGPAGFAARQPMDWGRCSARTPRKGPGQTRCGTYQAGFSARWRPCPQVGGAWKKTQSLKNASQTLGNTACTCFPGHTHPLVLENSCMDPCSHFPG